MPEIEEAVATHHARLALQCASAGAVVAARVAAQTPGCGVIKVVRLWARLNACVVQEIVAGCASQAEAGCQAAGFAVWCTDFALLAGVVSEIVARTDLKALRRVEHVDGLAGRGAVDAFC